MVYYTPKLGCSTSWVLAPSSTTFHSICFTDCITNSLYSCIFIACIKTLVLQNNNNTLENNFFIVQSALLLINTAVRTDVFILYLSSLTIRFTNMDTFFPYDAIAYLLTTFLPWVVSLRCTRRSVTHLAAISSTLLGSGPSSMAVYRPSLFFIILNQPPIYKHL